MTMTCFFTFLLHVCPFCHIPWTKEVWTCVVFWGIDSPEASQDSNDGQVCESTTLFEILILWSVLTSLTSESPSVISSDPFNHLRRVVGGTWLAVQVRFNFACSSAKIPHLSWEPHLSIFREYTCVWAVNKLSYHDSYCITILTVQNKVFHTSPCLSS